MEEIVLIGASGLAREVLSADQSNYRIVGILDDDADLNETVIGGVPVVGTVASAADRSERLVICVGSGAGRRSIVERLAVLGVTDDRFVTVVDSSVRVPGSCTVGLGSILLANVVLTADVTVGRHVVVMPNVTFTHDNRVGDFSTVAAGAAFGGNVRIGEASYTGMNASVRQHVSIGADSILGMGAVLLEDLPDHETWAGIPASKLGRNAPALERVDSLSPGAVS